MLFFAASLQFFSRYALGEHCESPFVLMPLAAVKVAAVGCGKCNPSPSATALAHLVSEMRQHKREVLLELLCFFVEDGIGACSPFVSATTRNRVSRLFRGILDVANLGTLCFAGSFFPLSALNEGIKCRCR
jgi:hypothetical protein